MPAAHPSSQHTRPDFLWPLLPTYTYAQLRVIHGLAAVTGFWRRLPVILETEK